MRFDSRATNRLPERGTHGAVGYDLFASEDTVVASRYATMVPPPPPLLPLEFCPRPLTVSLITCHVIRSTASSEARALHNSLASPL